jgi:hypothetical protein
MIELIVSITVILAMLVGYMAGTFAKKENAAKGTFIEKDQLNNRVTPWIERSFYPVETERVVNEAMNELAPRKKYMVMFHGKVYPGFNLITVENEEQKRAVEESLIRGAYLKRIE